MLKCLQPAVRPELHLITGSGARIDELITLAQAVLPYTDYIHLRDKQLPAKELYLMVQQLTAAGIPPETIVINDRVDVALAAGIRNVQLAGHSLPAAVVRAIAGGLRIGCSVHSVAEAIAAAKEGADYVLFGHVYESASKADIPGRGLTTLAEVTAACPVPVIAIGGIRPEHAAEAIRSGAQGIAVLSGLYHAPDPQAQASAYRRALEAAWLERG